MECCGNGVVCRSVVSIAKLVGVQGWWQHSADQHLDELCKAFAHYGVESNRAPVVWAYYFALFLYSMITDDLKQACTMPVERERLKMFVNTPSCWSAHALNTQPGNPSHPAAFRMLMRLNTTRSSSSVMIRALAVSSAE